MATVHTDLEDREVFQEVLDSNEGVIIIKFSAEWCGPCKLISPYVKEFISTLPENVTFYDLDVDDNFEIYAYLKSKKMVTGIPTMLAYFKDNKTFASNECVSGTTKETYEAFFTKCIVESNSYKN